MKKESNLQGFVKNEQLCGHYSSIGRALLSYEREAPLLLRSVDKLAMGNLKVALSFTPDCILDSYLEDLLDLGILDRDLFIGIPAFSARKMLVALPFAGLICSVGIGFHLSTLDFAYSYCVATIVVSSIPFALLWEWVPRSSNRRLFFARLVAAELSSRRGHGVVPSRKDKIEIKEVMVPSMGKIVNS